jgi:hypothetical protein
LALTENQLVKRIYEPRIFEGRVMLLIRGDAAAPQQIMLLGSPMRTQSSD